MRDYLAKEARLVGAPRVKEKASVSGDPWSANQVTGDAQLFRLHLAERAGFRETWAPGALDSGLDPRSRAESRMPVGLSLRLMFCPLLCSG